MRVDLSATGPKGVIDVRNVRYVYVQAQGGGSVGSAVLTLRRSFSERLDSPAVEFGGGTTADLTGGIVTIDVTDTAYVRLVCTTASAGADAEVSWSTSGEVEGVAFWQEVRLDAAGPKPEIDAAAYESALVVASVPLSNTAALSIRETQDLRATPQDYDTPASVALDGTVTEIPVVSSAWAVPVCTTAQSGQTAELFWYFRGEVIESSSGSGGASVEAARFSLSSTTGSFTTTATVCPLDREDEAQSWASNSSGTVTLDAGTYVVTADVTIDETAGNNRTEFGSVIQDNSSGSYVDVPGTERRHYSRNNAQGGQSASATCVLTLASSASVRIRSRRVSGTNTGEWIADGSSLTILKL